MVGLMRQLLLNMLKSFWQQAGPKILNCFPFLTKAIPIVMSQKDFGISLNNIFGQDF